MSGPLSFHVWTQRRSGSRARGEITDALRALSLHSFVERQVWCTAAAHAVTAAMKHGDELGERIAPLLIHRRAANDRRGVIHGIL